MIATDEDALICDLAETYHILNYRALPVSLLATLAVGLRETSRIKMRLCNAEMPLNSLLLAAMVDRLSVLVWAHSKDGQNGKNRPKSVLALLTGKEPERQVMAFDTAEEWQAAKNEILGVNHGN